MTKILIIAIFLTTYSSAFSQSGICDSITPFFSVDLTGQPGGAWVSNPPVQREGYCCDAGGNNGCIEFELTLDPGTAAIQFDILSGAIPGGSMFYQVNCGPEIAVGDPLCLSGVGPHIITFCKPGNNLNTYGITAIPEPDVSDDVTSTNNCSVTIASVGIQLTSITWTSVFPGNPGDWDGFLSCTSNCDSTIVTPTGAYPAYVDYQICGIPIAEECFPPGFYCDTVRVYMIDSLVIVINPNPAIFCEGESIQLNAVINGGAPPYSINWYDPFGNLINNESNTNGTVEGTYVIEVYDQLYPACPSHQESVDVSFLPPPIVNAGADVMICPTNPQIDLNGSVLLANGGQWTGNGGTFLPNNTTLNTTYTASSQEILSGNFYIYLSSIGNGPCASVTDSILVTVLDSVQVDIVGNEIVCNQESTPISAIPTGGLAPYTYLWNTGSTNSSIDVFSGTYSVTVTDNSINSCSVIESIVIVDNPKIDILVPGIPVIACDSIVSVTITASGGQGPLSYSWDTGDFGPTIQGNPGVYIVTVTDSLGCEETDSVMIVSSNSVLELTMFPQDTVCFEASTSFNTIATGGFSPYTYSWDNGVIGENNFGTAGVYCATVVDSAGCISSGCITIYEFDSMEVYVEQPDLICNGSTTSISAVVSGGGGPYTYEWSNGSFNSNVVVPAGAYTVTVTDASNPSCSAQNSVLVPEAPPLIIDFFVEDVSCFGGSDGIVTALPGGGVFPYSYQWSTGSFDSLATSLSASTIYSIIVTDSLNCQIIGTISINEPPLIELTTSSSQISCFGGSDGTMNATVFGGTQPYSYDWFSAGGDNLGQVSQEATGLSIGTYYVLVTDTNDCQMVSLSTTLSEPTAVDVNLTLINPSCFNSCDGSISAVPSGGNGGYSYVWSDPLVQTDSMAVNLCEGGFTVIVTDMLGCLGNAYDELVSPDILSIDTSTVSANCGLSNGEGCVVVTGGTAPYSYSWPGGFVSNCVTGMFAGSYLVETTDVNNCQMFAAVNIQDVEGPEATMFNVVNNDCEGDCNGSATVGFGGGLMNVQWSDNANNQITPIASNLCTGIYGVTVTDTLGCVSALSVNITSPSELVINLTLTNPICYSDCNGTATAQVVGGALPYVYQWYNSSGVALSAEPGPGINGLCANNYSLIVTDANGCSSSVSFLIADPLLNTVVLSTVDASCYEACNGVITITPEVGLFPFTYSWSANASNQNSSIASGLCAGNYSCIVIDANNCQVIVNEVINEPDELVVNFSNVSNISCNGLCNGSVEAVPSGGVGPYTFLWSNGFTGANLSGLCSGGICLTVTDANGCQVSDCITITEPDILEVLMSSQDVSCNGLCDGLANVLVTGGVIPYTVAWDAPGFPNSVGISDLCGGLYNCDVIDASGCTVSDFVVIGEPSSMSLSILSIANANCGQSNGQICTDAIGGVGSLSYQWSDPVGQTSACLSNVPSGCYSLVVSDENGCQMDSTICLNNVAGPIINLDSQINETCIGNSDGIIAVSVTNMTLPITTTWTDSDGNQLNAFNDLFIATSLMSDCYVFTVLDGLGCSSSMEICLDNPSPVYGVVSQIDEPTCFGFCDGSATVLVGGGVLPYSYNWSSGNTSTLQETGGLCAGSISVTISDGNGCQLSIDTMLTEPVELFLENSTVSQINCSNDCTGYLSVDIGGGTGSYTYLWTPNVSSNAFAENLCEGDKTISIIDLNGCDTSFTFSISAPLALTLSVSTTNATCGECNGSATATVNNGTGGYLYLWDSGQITPTVNGMLCPGENGVTVTDELGCTIQADVVVVDESGPVIDSIVVVPPLCFGDNNGEVTAYASGGLVFGNYAYDWGANTGDQPTQTAVALVSDYYCVTVTDLNNCDAYLCEIMNEPSEIVGVAMFDSTLCYGGEAQFWAGAQGGTLPYSINWTTNPPLNGPGPHVMSPENDIMYCMSVTDANGCVSNEDCVEFAVSAPFTIVALDQTALCVGDSALISAEFNGGLENNIVINWYQDELFGSNINSQNDDESTTAMVTPQDSTWYYVTINDGCTEMGYDSVLVPVHFNPDAQITLINTLGCAPLNTTVLVSPATALVYNYDFQCDDNIDISSNDSIANYIYTQEGEYNICVTIIDGFGCINTLYAPELVTVWPVPEANFVASPMETDIFNSTVEFTDLSSGNSINTWLYESDTITGAISTSIIAQNTELTWGSYSLFSHTFLEAGSYPITLYASNEFACYDSITKVININEVYNIFVPNVITPTEDMNNEVFHVIATGVDESNFILLIYNRWGELVFETNDIYEGWDGAYQGELVADGVYIWKIEALDLNGNSFVHTGHVTVLK